jgi:hypothetical protein
MSRVLGGTFSYLFIYFSLDCVEDGDGGFKGGVENTL